MRVLPQSDRPLNGLTVVDFSQFLSGHGDGFLARDPGKGKDLLYLSGTHYEMGFQTGLLAPARTARMVHDYCNEFLFEMLELPLSSGDLGVVWEWVRAWLHGTRRNLGAESGVAPVGVAERRCDVRPVQAKRQQAALQVGFVPGREFRRQAQVGSKPDVELVALAVLGFEYPRQEDDLVQGNRITLQLEHLASHVVHPPVPVL